MKFLNLKNLINLLNSAPFCFSFWQVLPQTNKWHLSSTYVGANINCVNKHFCCSWWFFLWLWRKVVSDFFKKIVTCSLNCGLFCHSFCIVSLKRRLIDMKNFLTKQSQSVPLTAYCFKGFNNVFLKYFLWMFEFCIYSLLICCLKT